MSIIHINQIREHVTKLFENKLDMSDITCNSNDRSNFFLSRALAAYAIHYLSVASESTAAAAVTDGPMDNGIDAIHFDESDKRLYIVQSKWIHDGKGEPSKGEVDKFVLGTVDLFNTRFDRFNKNIQQKKETILKALKDPNARYSIVIVHTGVNKLAAPALQDLKVLQNDLNDASEVVDITVLSQSELHTSLTIGLTGEPIDLEINVKSWGQIQEPYSAIYGQIEGKQIADWWTKYHTRLLSKNLRSILGETEVNAEIRETLINQPEHFWYFNNGITIVAQSVKKAMLHGANREVGTFHCKDVSVVNGAQTVGTIGRYTESSLTEIKELYVPLRIISLESSPLDFGMSVTRTNNRQNRIDNRDFVSLDPEQARLRKEFAIEGINYHVIRSESFQPTEKAFDVVESTIALACASGKGHLVVQLKREIGKLWEDISTSPYKELFNASVSWLYVWRCVRVQRLIDAAVKSLGNKETIERETAILIHGNRLIASIVFMSFQPQKNFVNPNYDFNKFITSDAIENEVNRIYTTLQLAIDTYFPHSLVHTLFKNLSKCRDLIDRCQMAPTTIIPKQYFLPFMNEDV